MTDPKSRTQFEVSTEREIPQDLRNSYDRACAAVFAGVGWNGNVDSIGGVTKDEALQVADAFLRKFGAWLRDPS